MRLWSLHPAILDQKGLGAAWREGLMAQSVIAKLQAGQKPGYRNHPQLKRFLATEQPLKAIGYFLTLIWDEAKSRGYNYNYALITCPDENVTISVTDGQLRYEYQHLLCKLKKRLPADHKLFADSEPVAGDMFEVVPGDVEEWEKK